MTSNTFRRARRFINRGNLINLFTAPQCLRHAVAHQLTNGFGRTTESLLDRNFTHIASFTTKNAGDTLLPTVLRDLFNIHIGGIHWTAKHVHDRVDFKDLRELNKSKALILGGGGLFLGDTNRNNVSGWQWPISTQSIQSLTSKIVVFAVGYNKFRGQDEFDGNFRNTVTALAERSVFFGLRNHGSIESIKDYLPLELHGKLRYQPCMTTVLRDIYPDKFSDAAPLENGVVALNCAFDRANLRYGGREHDILRDIAKVMKELSKRERICYFSHTREDEAALDALKRENVPFKNVRLYDMPSRYVFDCYKNVKLAIGMRGHAQMIPFGCGAAVISLISHDKMRWFLDDISCPEFGVEINSSHLYEHLLEKSNFVLENLGAVANRLDFARKDLWTITQSNLGEITTQLTSSDSQAYA